MSGLANGSPAKRLSEAEAREILDASHIAWSNGDLDATLACYVDDLEYCCNLGPGGAPLRIFGKVAFRAFLLPIWQTVEGMTATEYFRLVDGTGRAKIEYFLRHKTTCHTLVGSYRQVVTFRDAKIWRLSEFHDAALMAAFWRLTAREAELESARI